MSASKNIVLTLFSSRTCSLCSTAKDSILKAQQKVPFQLNVLDIHEKECPKDLADRYMFDIPVVHLNNEFLVQHRVPQDKLVEALQKYQVTGKVEKI
ncbi:thioredoxin-like protein [Absidia repens]|uniref:Glutaredoxin-like protein n=1 Tax=Absidia repens TaxID=90262 RepID=A0A1X2HXC2_9FUNG|nr:thioredoxin-like protein [Absidia repens]